MPEAHQQADLGKKLRFRVAIVYKTLPHYRTSFFAILRHLLAEDGIELVLIHGSPYGDSNAKQDWAELPGAHVIENKIVTLGRHELIWQPCLSLVRDCDLVIAEQASKLLVNYVFHTWSLIGRRKFALWGHGRNLQGHDASAIAELLKRSLLRWCDWWFAYTAETQAYLEAAGVPSARITTVQNAINEEALIDAAQSVDRAEIDEIRNRLGLRGENVALFIGSLYPEKRLEFLLAACAVVRQHVPDFEMVFIGAGPQEAIIKEACSASPFMHHVAPVRGHEKIAYFRLAKLMLMPGLVGLASAEAINFGLPLITVELPYHSPEIAYVREGINGVRLPEGVSAKAYALTVVRYLRDEQARSRLRDGCLKERYQYTAEAMAQRFASGVRECLGIEYGTHSSLAAPNLASPV